MEILIIHNPERKDRQKQLIRELIVQGIATPSFMPAVTNASKPSIGINQAHRQCIHWAWKMGLPEVCIMEDDVAFTKKDSFSIFQQNYKHLPPDADIFLAGMYTGSVTPVKTFDDGPVGIASTHAFSGLHCYIVKQKYYETYLRAPKQLHIDRWLGMRTKNGGQAKVYLCYPMVALQHPGYSDNTKQVMNYDYLLTKAKYKIYGQEQKK